MRAAVPAAVGLAVAGAAAWQAAGVLAGVAAALAAMAMLRRSTLGAEPQGVAVDAEGHWAVRLEGKWHRLALTQVSASPLGWMTLQGHLRPLAGSASVRPPVRMTLWRDGIEPSAWRCLSVAAQWRRHRTPLGAPAFPVEVRP